MHLKIDAKDLPTIQHRHGERSSNLDNSYKDSMCQLAAGVIVVTHDHRFLDVFDTVYELEDGVLRQRGRTA